MDEMPETYSSTEIAEALDLSHAGPDVRVEGVASLDRATTDDLAFCVHEDPTYVAETDAGAVICPISMRPPGGETVLYAENPRLAFARAAETFFVRARSGGVHPTAVVEDGATIGSDVTIGPHVTVGECVTLGDDVTVRAGAVLGSAGFGFARDADAELHRVPHRGRVVVEDGVEIGANSTVDRPVFEETVVGEGTKLSGNVHLAHHVRLGSDTTVACNCGLAGGAVVGDRVTVHPHVSVANDVRVGDEAELAMNAAVLDDVEPGTTVAGSPARPIR